MGRRWWNGSPAAVAPTTVVGTIVGVAMGWPTRGAMASFSAFCPPARLATLASWAATLTSCAASGAATASLAADWIAGFKRGAQRMAARTRRASRAATAFMVQGGRTASCSITPSTVTGGVDWGLTTTWNGWVLGGPFKNRLMGRTDNLVKDAVLGSVTSPAGENRKRRLPSASLASRSALRRTLPRLSTASSWRAWLRPRDVRGMSSPKTSLKLPTSRVPSSVTDPWGSSFDATRTPNGKDPAATSDDRGGRKATVAVPSVPGSRESVEGWTVLQAAGSPTTSRLNWSTTVPVLRTLISAVASAPGSTDSVVGLRLATAPMKATLPGSRRRRHRLK